MQANQFRDFTVSSTEALSWAQQRANQRARGSRSARGEVSPIDLLAGVFLAHPSDSEPFQLLQHFGAQPDRLFEAMRADGGFAPSDAPEVPERLARVPPLDGETAKIVELARNLSQTTNPEPERLIRLRDLFGGLLLVPNEARDLLQRHLAIDYDLFSGVIGRYQEFLSFPSEKMSLGQYLADRFPTNPQNVEQPPVTKPNVASSVLPNGRPDGSKPAEDLHSLEYAVSGFSADSRTGQDQIGIGADVDAFAYLIAAKALQPPLAIGLFGDWGAGKSFFMESLRKRIDKITLDASESPEPQGSISVYKCISQIEFNAWHYVEGDLWASLVEHIFHSLQTGPGRVPTPLENEKKLWIEKHEIARRDKEAADAHRERLASELAKSKDRVHVLEADRRARLSEVKGLQLVNVAKIVQAGLETEEVKSALDELGLPQTAKSAEELIRSADQLRTVINGGNALIAPIRKYRWKWVLALVLIALIGPVVSYALSRLADVPMVTNALASVAALLSGLAILLKTGTSWIEGVLAALTRAKAKVDSLQDEAEANVADQLAEAERAYTQKKAEYELATRRQQEMEDEIAGIDEAIGKITPGRVLLDFVNKRVGSDDYRKHLGMAALIRSDFEQLSQLVAEYNERADAKDDDIPDNQGKRTINRIVLYIDDLDRCPPERVVKVLQAVHLLLAFPLFVVVVAVDARWLAQSLQAHYRNLLAGGTWRDGLEMTEGFERQASPQDYLEKIFQIPYWVGPLSESARVRLVQGLVQPRKKESTTHDFALIELRPSMEITAADKLITPSWTKQEPGTLVIVEPRRPLDLAVPTDLAAKSLDLGAEELEFIFGLRSLLGQTPRSVKRFVNVFRLIKAISLDQQSGYPEGRQRGDLKHALFLLAVLTGLPAISREFFRLLHDQRSEIEAVNERDAKSQENGRTLRDVMADLRRFVSMSIEPPPDGAGPNALRKDVTGAPVVGVNQPGYAGLNALRELDRLEAWLKRYEGGKWLAADATAVADWTPRVARYSYRMEEL